MSYDIDLHCPTCGRSPGLPGPTYNLTPIFDRALTGEELPNPDVGEAGVVLFGQQTDRPRGLRLLDGRTGEETATWIEKALGHLNDPNLEHVFRALEPENKWGDLAGAREVMLCLLEAARENPKAVWRIR